jgi:hypothetical protein
MKKFLSLIMVLTLTGMVAAADPCDVDFDPCDIGDGQLRIAYTVNGDTNPRGIALKISLSDGAYIVGAGDVLSSDPCYNVNIDYAYDPCTGDPCDYQIGEGHPLADADGPGVPDPCVSVFSICMGSLDQSGNQDAGPSASDDLITLQLHFSGSDTTATIQVDSLRGGVVGSQLTTNLPIQQVVKAPVTDCVKQSAPFHSLWVTWGKPDCWCYHRNCRGDANGAKLGSYWVQTADLNIFKTAYFKTITQLQTIPNGICCDFNRAKLGSYHVQTADLNIFKQYYFKPIASVPCCDYNQDCVTSASDPCDYYNYWTNSL